MIEEVFKKYERTKERLQAAALLPTLAYDSSYAGINELFLKKSKQTFRIFKDIDVY